MRKFRVVFYVCKHYFYVIAKSMCISLKYVYMPRKILQCRNFVWTNLSLPAIPKVCAAAHYCAAIVFLVCRENNITWLGFENSSNKSDGIMYTCNANVCSNSIDTANIYICVYIHVGVDKYET